MQKVARAVGSTWTWHREQVVVWTYCLLQIKTSSLNKDSIFILGIINSEGKLWKEQRKFLHERLRHFGMTYFGAGKDSMEKRIKVRSQCCSLSLKMYPT